MATESESNPGEPGSGSNAPAGPEASASADATVDNGSATEPGPGPGPGLGPEPGSEPEPEPEPKAPRPKTPKRRKSDARKPKPKSRKTKAGHARSNGGGESKHSKRRIASVAKQAEALEYRKMGLSYAQIADKCGLNSAQNAWNAVESALKRTLQEPADEVRKLESARLDAMFIQTYNNAQKGDLQSIAAALNIMARRARLLGLDAPVRSELTGKDGEKLMAAPTIIIGGPGEEGEPEIMGESVVPPVDDGVPA